MTRTRLPRTLLRTAVPAAAVIALAVTGAGAASADTVAFTAYDTDGNGYSDVYGFDGDSDGWEDTWAYDLDEDGVPEQVGVDTDYDGWDDVWAYDEDEDGYVEAVGVDTTGNGAPDVWGADLDLDGYVDTLFHDDGDDGIADWSEPANSSAYAYEAVTFVFVEADGWVYWEATYEYGTGYDYATAPEDAPQSRTGEVAQRAGLQAAAVDAADGEVAPVEEAIAFVEATLSAN